MVKQYPQIKLDGWWWKRFIPKYRRLQKTAQLMIEKDWDNGMEKRVRDYVIKAMLYGKN